MCKRKMEERGCCGTCKYHRFDPDEKEYLCMNQESDNFVLETNFCDTCIDYVERKRQ